MKLAAAMDPMVPAAPLDPVQPGNALANAPSMAPVRFRRFDDIEGQRDDIYNSAIEALRARRPVENATHRIELADIDYEGPFTPLKSDEKKMIMQGASLHRPLRGTVRLIDKATEQPLDEQRVTLARIPHLNSRGLFIRNGVVWSIRNQTRLRPGAYTRKRADGGTETHFNVKPGTGRVFRLLLEPESGLMKMQIGQSTTRLYPLLRKLGIEDEQIKEAWGEELYEKNFRVPSGNDIKDLEKVVGKLGSQSVEVEEAQLADAFREILEKAEIDPDTAELTMGERIQNLSPDALLKSTKRILRVATDQEQGDNRDSQAYQSIHSTEDFVKERLQRDQAGTLRKLLWKAGREGKLGNIPTGVMDKNLGALFEGSGLALAVEDINPFEIHDMRQAITRLGQGGISSEQAVSRDARGVQASYLGVIDAARGPESSKIGLDLRVTDAALKGSDNQLYTTVMNIKTGKAEPVSARDLSRSVVAFPGEMEKDSKRVPAIKDDQVQYVTKDEVDFVIPDPNDLMSRATAMIPFPQSIKGQRLLMGSRMTQQAMPLKEPEAPLVQTATPDGSSMHKEMGRYVGAAYAPVGGVVTQVTPDQIKIRTRDGENKIVDLYNNYPSARKTMVHNTPVVEKGALIEPGQLLARSNFTDDTGTAAIGKNLRVAFMAAEGDTIEDAFVISESAAKKLTSEAMYKSDLDLADVESTSKDDYISIYSDKFDQEQYGKIDDDGLIKVGSKVEPGDPLILGFGKKDKKAIGAVMETPRSQLTDRVQTWDHHAPGVVTDVTKTRKGIKVSVKSYDIMRAADKLSGRYGNKGVISCYDNLTWVFTEAGWKLWPDVTESDRFACLIEGALEFHPASALTREPYDGDMLCHESDTHLDYAVTPNHRMWCRGEHYSGKASLFRIRDAADVHGKRVSHACRHGEVSVPTSAAFEVPLRYESGRGWQAKRKFDTLLFAEFLGYWLAEGSLASYRGDAVGVTETQVTSYKIQIAKSAAAKPEKYRRICTLLTEMGLGIVRRPTQITFSNKAIHAWLSPFSGCANKQVPEECWGWGTRAWRVMFDALISCDGTTLRNKDGTVHRTYFTTSPQLAEDVDRLACLLGYTSRAATHHPEGPSNRHCYMVVIRESREIGAKSQYAAARPYKGEVHCAQVPGGLLLVRRNGCSFWCGNSIRPDEQMPMNADGEPIEVIANALGIVSRTNPGALAEALLGKVAQVRGEPYVVKGFGQEDVTEFALQEALKYGVIEQDPTTGRIKDTETLTDPRDGSQIPNIFTGVSYFMKPQHMAESKLGARDVSTYTTEGIPARGGKEGCFVAGQKVLTDQGSVEIGHLCEKRLGLSVLTWNGTDWVYRPVTDWFTYTASVADIITVKFMSPASDRGVFKKNSARHVVQSFSATTNHEIVTAGGVRKLAGDLTLDDELSVRGVEPTSNRLTAVPAKILSIEPYQHDKPGVDEINVYDITVADTHLYCAGGALVSNSKRVAMLDSHALLAAGATEFLKDAKLIRGQRNDDYWRSIRAGEEPIAPTRSFANDHFKDLLRAAGVNLREEGSRTQLSPMTDQDVEALAEHEIENPGTFNFESMKPVEGGLFDMKATGGASGGRFAKITLPEPVPHPLFMEPIQRLLGLTRKKLDQVMKGEEKLDNKTGPQAVYDALSQLDVRSQMNLAKEQIRTGRGQKRDLAVKKLNYLTGLQDMELKPNDLMVTKIPVIPPKYRPITSAKGMDMVHDLNYLYHDLLEARKNYKDANETFGEAGEEYLTMVNAVQAISGLRDPVNQKSAEQGVKGVLRFAIGVGDTPKRAMYQRKVLGSAVDTVGRGVITADSDLDMDQVGIPKDMAFKIFRPYVIRRLSRMGMPATEALDAVDDQNKIARTALEEEMKDRPVVYNRAPALHRYAYVGAYGKIRDDDAIGLPYHTLKGIGGDYDGDQINIHVPSSAEAVADAKDKLMPSKNLFFTGDFETHYEPMQDYLAGLYLASTPDMEEPVRTFATEEEARRAFTRGDINARTPIRILK